MKSTIEQWEELFIQYRGSEMAVLYLEALRQGLRLGQLTADDLRHIPVINGSVRGAVMKGLRRGGLFEKVGYQASQTEGRNGSAVAVWRLAEPVLAKAILNKVAGQVVRKTEQLSFC